MAAASGSRGHARAAVYTGEFAAQAVEADKMTTHFETTDPYVTPATRIAELIKGLENTQLLHVVAKLGIADLLDDGPKTAEELAEATGANAPLLFRVLRALAADHVFSQDDAGRFGLTWESAYLRTGVPGSLRSFAIMSGDEWYVRTYRGLYDMVKTGKYAFETVFGEKIYEYLEKHPEDLRSFHEFMDENSRYHAPVILEHFDFSRYSKIVELGVGRASLILLLLQRFPALRAVLFDAPHVLKGTRPLLEAAGLAERCEFVEGSFHESVPSGGDVYLIRNVLTDWNDEQVLRILRNCRKAMPPEAVLLISEPVLEEGPAPYKARLCDIMVMVGCDGKQRTGTEWKALLNQAGFDLSAVHPTGPYNSVVEARPV
jgi:hypothetical protein